MSRDCEAMSFVANLLDQMQARMIGCEPHRFILIRHDQLFQSRLALFAFGHTNHRDRSESQFLQHLARRR
jgi:hypothetical protein